MTLIDGLPIMPGHLPEHACRCLLTGYHGDGWVWIPCLAQQVHDSPFCAGCADRHPEAERVGIDPRPIRT